jgi:hypothetical protein
MWYLKAEWMIVWVTLAYTAVSSLALAALAVQVWIMRGTAKRQLRAYMVVRSARLYIDEDGTVEAKMEIANCGQTPAFDLQGAHISRFDHYPVQSPGIPPDELRQSQSVIGAGLAFHLLSPCGRHDKGNRDHLLGKLSAEDKLLVYCVNGYYTYRDIFRDTHHLRFQLIIGGPAGVRIDRDKDGMFAALSNDSAGNDAD